MDGLYERLRAGAGTYWGRGDGPESGPFTGRVAVTAAAGSVELAYEAWSPAQGLQHQERAVLTDGPAGLQLVTVLSEVPGALRFAADGDRFALADPAPYAMAVDLRLDAGRLTWAWRWAELGQVPVEQSRLLADRVA